MTSLELNYLIEDLISKYSLIQILWHRTSTCAFWWCGADTVQPIEWCIWESNGVVHGKKTHLETMQIKILVSLFLLSDGIWTESVNSLRVPTVLSSESGRHCCCLSGSCPCGKGWEDGQDQNQWAMTLTQGTPTVRPPLSEEQTPVMARSIRW